jgi:SOS response regulatory protein OraA/RecX
VRQYLRTGPRSARELSAHLERSGAPPAIVDEVLSACRASGLIDDVACAKLVAGHWARHGYAWAAIRLKLADKGVDDDAIRAAERDVDGSDGDPARARALIGQRLASGQASAHRQRLARLLASHGYEPDLIEHVITQAVGAPSDS